MLVKIAKWGAIAVAVVLAVPVALRIYAGMPLYYWAEPIEARVVDEETQAPLEGVVVVAHWHLVGFHGAPAGELEIFETVTSSDGRFSFPGWGPRIVLWAGWGAGHLLSRAPRLILLKRGYLPLVRMNETTVKPGTSRRTSMWNGKSLGLRKAASEGEYANRLANLGREVEALGFRSTLSPCRWQNFPRLLTLLTEESSELQRSLDPQVRFNGGGYDLGNFEELARRKRWRCGSVKSFLESGG